MTNNLTRLNLRRKNQITALSWMVVGSFVVFGAIIAINKFAQGPDEQQLVAKTTFEVQKQAKPRPKRLKKKEPPARQRQTRAPKAPIDALAASISGIDFGLPGFNLDELSELGDILGENEGVVMTDDSVDEPPRPRVQTSIAYPAAAKQQGIEGYVILTLLITESGEVARVKILESVPSGVFDSAAIQGVRQWSFEPATYQGERVRVWAKQKVRFDLS